MRETALLSLILYLGRYLGACNQEPIINREDSHWLSASIEKVQGVQVWQIWSCPCMTSLEQGEARWMLISAVVLHYGLIEIIKADTLHMIMIVAPKLTLYYDSKSPLWSLSCMIFGHAGSHKHVMKDILSRDIRFNLRQMDRKCAARYTNEQKRPEKLSAHLKEELIIP